MLKLSGSFYTDEIHDILIVEIKSLEKNELKFLTVIFRGLSFSLPYISTSINDIFLINR